MKGYKVTNPDYTCRGVKFEAGQTYKIDAEPIPCKIGYHFCKKVADCFNYYSFDPNNKVFEVEAVGKVIEKGDKAVTNELLIVRELTWSEMLELANTGKGNSGHSNSGDYNSGDYNSGDRNSGYRNSGDCNSGDCNSGDCNSGKYNSGDRNSGDCNSGDYNSGNYHTGAFCTGDAEFKLFNKTCKTTRWQFVNSRANGILNRLLVVEWVADETLCSGGTYKKIDYKTAWANLWQSLSEEERQVIQSIENFDWDIFTEITGIKKFNS